MQEVSQLLATLRQEWPECLEEEFSPLPLVLEMASSSPHTKTLNDLNDILHHVGSVLDDIVDNHYQGFNQSVHTFTRIVETVSDCQERTVKLQQVLMSAKSTVECKRVDLTHLWVKSVQYKDIIRILDQIEDLIKVSDHIDTLIQDKFFLHATQMIVSNLKLLNSSELKDIGCLNDIRQGLDTLQKQLHHVLIEELHNHIYLKSPQFRAEFIEAESANEDLIQLVSKQQSRLAHQGKTKFVSRSLNDLNSKETLKSFASLNLINENDPKIVEELSRLENVNANPESDTNVFMGNLIHCIALLRRIPECTQAILDRLKSEFFALIDKTIRDVEEFHNAANISRKINAMFSDEDGPSKKRQSEMFKDLLRVLYKRLQVAIKKHRFVIEQLNSIQSKENDRQKNVHTIEPIIDACQTQVKVFLLDYLKNIGDTELYRADPVSVISDILRSHRPILEQRDDSRILFDLMDTFDQNALRESDGASGFPNDEKIRSLSGVMSNLSSSSISHRLIITPSMMNIVAVYNPTIAFTEKLIQGTDVDMENCELVTFMSGFVETTFLPRMNDSTLLRVEEAIDGLDPFETRSMPHAITQRDLVMKSARSVLQILRDISQTSAAIPTNQGDYVDMIVLVLDAYFSKCQGKYTELVEEEIVNKGQASGIPLSQTSIFSAMWAKDDTISNLLRSYIQAEDADDSWRKSVSEKEVKLQIQLLGERSIHLNELLRARKDFLIITSIYTTLEWLTDRVADMEIATQNETQDSVKRSSLESIDIEHGLGSLDSVMQNSSTALQDSSATNSNFIVPLPSSEDSREKIAQVVAKIKELMELCVFTLHLEFRCHCIYYIDLALREGNYFLDEEASDPDPYIISLNDDLVTCEEFVTLYLNPDTAKFMFEGLATLTSRLLISHIRYIKRMNLNGVSKMIRNINALKQNMVNIAMAFSNTLSTSANSVNFSPRNSVAIFPSVDNISRSSNFLDDSKRKTIAVPSTGQWWTHELENAKKFYELVGFCLSERQAEARKSNRSSGPQHPRGSVSASSSNQPSTRSSAIAARRTSQEDTAATLNQMDAGSAASGISPNQKKSLRNSMISNRSSRSDPDQFQDQLLQQQQRKKSVTSKRGSINLVGTVEKQPASLETGENRFLADTAAVEDESDIVIGFQPNRLINHISDNHDMRFTYDEYVSVLDLLLRSATTVEALEELKRLFQ